MFDIEGKRIKNKESLDEDFVTFRIIKVAVRFSEKKIMTRVLTESNTAVKKKLLNQYGQWKDVSVGKAPEKK